MCLEIKGKLKTASKDFYTLKFVSDPTKRGCLSYYMRVPLKFNKVLNSNLTASGGEVGPGFHSLLIRDEKSIWLGRVWWDPITYEPLGVILCKIPKGSNYYLGKDGDVASDNIILLEVVATNSSNLLRFKFNVDTERRYWSQLRDGWEDIINYVKSLNINTTPS